MSALESAQAAGTGGIAVALEDATFSYEGEAAPAVRGATLRIEPGSCVVLTGPSGCGKTTACRLVNGLVPVAYCGALSGSVRVGGTEVGSWRMDDLCRAVGSVFQNPRSQFFNLDTTSEVAFGCENLGITREEIHARVDAAFADVGIEGLRDRDIRALSGGQRQAVAIACALALGPQAFLLDEPTASLDVASMRQLADVVARLRAMGKTVVVSEHRLWWLAGIADRVAVMDGGRVVGDFTAEEFARMDGAERERLGLRAWNVADLGQRALAGAAGLGAEGAGERGRRQGAPEAGGPWALEVEGLVAGYGRGAPVLDGVDMRLAPGTVTALVGHNGAGKTTLARCIVGLHRERAGHVRLCGEEPRWRKRPGAAYLVMQEPGYQLFSDSVAAELAQAAARGLGVPPGDAASDGVQAQVAGALERFGLAPVAERHPLSLSGGQRQRLAIALGVLQGAGVLVLDEPTSGLDLRNMRRVAAEMAAAAQAGAAVVVVTHDLELICSACTQAVLLDGGRAHPPVPVDAQSLPAIRAALGFDVAG